MINNRRVTRYGGVMHTATPSGHKSGRKENTMKNQVWHVEYWRSQWITGSGWGITEMLKRIEVPAGETEKIISERTFDDVRHWGVFRDQIKRDAADIPLEDYLETISDDSAGDYQYEIRLVDCNNKIRFRETWWESSIAAEMLENN